MTNSSLWLSRRGTGVTSTEADESRDRGRMASTSDIAQTLVRTGTRWSSDFQPDISG